MANPKIAVQVYSIGKIYDENPYEAFKIIKDCGYDAVEMVGKVIMEATELKKMLDDVGLECCGWHTPWEYIGNPDILEMFITYNKIVGNKYLISTPWGYRRDMDNWLEGCAKMNEIAARLKKCGMHTGIHFDASPKSSVAWGATNEQLLDVFAANTVDDIVLQLDTGNGWAGGAEPVAAIKKFKNRYQTIHFKPYSPTRGYPPIGEDDTDWAEIVKYLKEYGNTEYYIIEHEVPNAKVEIKTCIDNFKKFL